MRVISPVSAILDVQADERLGLAAGDELGDFLSQMILMCGLANSRSCRIFSARKLSRRWISVTSWLWLVR